MLYGELHRILYSFLIWCYLTVADRPISIPAISAHVDNITMMSTDRAFATATKSTPKGHLTEAEVWSNVTDLADKANAAAGLTSALDAALRECLVEAVMGPGSSEHRLPESESTIIRTAAMHDTDLNMNVLHSFIMNEVYHTAARASITRFAESQVARAKTDMLNELNARMNSNGHPSLPNVLQDILTRQGDMTNILQVLQQHRVAEASMAGRTARSKLVSRRLEIEKEFDSSAEHNSKQLKAVVDCSKQIFQIEQEREVIESGGIVTIRARKEDLKELSDLQQIAERRKTKSERDLMAYYEPDPGNVSAHKREESSLKLIPQGLEKGKGGELADKAKIWSKSHIKKTFVIHRFIVKATNHFDPEKGQYWKPPSLSDLSDVPDIEKSQFRSQCQWLWDHLVAGALYPDLVKLILRPSKKGYYDDIPVIAEEGNGVLALWALMMHFRKCSETHCLSLIECLEQSQNLFRSPKANIASSVKQVASVLKECLDLGVQVPWKNTGRPVASILRNKGYDTYLFPFRHGGIDPQDSAVYFLEMLDVIETATTDVEDIQSKNVGRKSWQAHEAKVFEVVEGGNNPNAPFQVVESPNPMYDPSHSSAGEWAEDYYEAHEAQDIGMGYEGYEGEGYGWEEHEEPEWSYDHYDNDYHAYSTFKGNPPSFSKGGKKGKYSKGGDKGKGGKGKWGAKGKSKGGRGYHPYSRPNGKPCPVKGCTRYANSPFTYCYNCHQEGLRTGSLTLATGEQVPVARKDAQKGGAPRAFEAIEVSAGNPNEPSFNTFMNGMVDEWMRKSQPGQQAAIAHTPYNAMSAVTQQPDNSAQPRVSPAARLQEMWKQQEAQKQGSRH